MGSQPPPTSFRSTKDARYAQAYMMDDQLAGDRRKLRIDRIQQGIITEHLTALPAGALVVDVPCGNGRMTQRVARPDLKLVAMDYNHTMLQAMAQRGSSRMLACRSVADIMRLPLPDKCVDLFINMRLLHHVPDQPTRVAMLREIVRVCRGTIITSYWTTRCWRYARKRLLGKKLRGISIPPAVFVDACGQAGLTIERQVSMRPLWEDEIVVIGRPK